MSAAVDAPDSPVPVPQPALRSYDAMWAELTPIGREASTGGYRR